MGGFFGCISKKTCVNQVFYGTDYHSHLGTRRGGMAFFNKGNFSRAIHNIENSYFRNKFEDELPKFSGNAGIGIISDYDSQPILVNSHLGKFAVATVGVIKNIDELEARALKRRTHFGETTEGGVNPTELVAMMIAEEEDIVSGIEKSQELIKGSCSILVLMDNRIFAARDRLGRTPIVIGKNEDGFAVASENCSFANLGFDTEKYLGPGEILELNAEEYTIRKPAGNKMQICSFLWVYYGYPATNYEGINTEDVRYKCGAALAKRDEVCPDLVAGIPDSGIGHAVGYSNEKQIPYKRAFVKYTPTWPRSFMPQNQEIRDLVAKMKLIPIKELIKNKKLAFCDDSIVRGTQLKDNTKILFDAGAEEVHIRIACPTLVYPCEFLNFSRSRSSLELAGRRAIKQIEGKEDKNIQDYVRDGSSKQEEMHELIRQRLGITSLRYQRLDDLIEAIGLPKEQLCTHCWDGSSTF